MPDAPKAAPDDWSWWLGALCVVLFVWILDLKRKNAALRARLSEARKAQGKVKVTGELDLKRKE